MKSIYKFFLIAGLGLLLNSNLIAQDSFSGIITYQIKFDGLELDAELKSALPSEMIVILKDKKSKSILPTMMGDQITIYNGESKTLVNLIEIMGQKIAINKSSKEIEIERNKYKNLIINLSTETKEIAGYLCKKAEVEVNAADFDGLSKFSIFYTEELGNLGINYSDALFNKIKGVMLQYEIKTKGLMMKFSAIDIKATEISDEEFKIPAEYKEMTKEELNNLFGDM